MSWVVNRQLLEYKAKAKRELDLRMSVNPLNWFIPIEHPQLMQKEFIDSPKKNKLVSGGNRSTKTVSGAVHVISNCLDYPGYDAWAATWADLSVPILQAEYWRWLPKDNTVKYAQFSEQRGFSNRIILFTNESKIRFKTYDQGRESFQGAKKHIIHLDEESPEEIVKECKVRLIDANGMLIRTLTPLKGITYTHDEFIENAKDDPEIAYWYFDSRYNPHIDQEAQKRIIGSYAEKEAEVRQTGHFVDITSGRAYYTFSNENIIGEEECKIKSFEYMKFRPLEISCDFNIDLMCWNIGQEQIDNDIVFDFVELENEANTDYLCQVLKNKYSQHEGGWHFYGDISGNKRDPAAAKTNWAIIREHFPNARIDYQNIRNIKDRIDSFNGRIKNSSGVHWFVTKNCKRLIRDCRQVTWEHLLNKNKAGKLTHASDGESYKMLWKHSLMGKIRSKQL